MQTEAARHDPLQAHKRPCFVCRGAGRNKIAEVLNGPRPGPIYRECVECNGTGLFAKQEA